MARWLESREAQFWMLHILGWAGFGVATYLGVIPVAKEEVIPQYYRHVLFMISVGILLSLGLRYIFRAIWDSPVALRATVSVVAVLLISMIWIVARSWFFLKLYPAMNRPDAIIGYFAGFPYALSVMLGWSGLYYAIRYYRILQQQTAQYHKASAMAHQAQLKMLRYQLNPHFLFNTLNAISTLILDQDQRRANDMVGKLSEFLRYSLDNDPMQKVTLKSELHALNLYLGIEKVRFQDRLSLDIRVEPEAHRALVPSLILQPLVENAVKYAVAPQEDGGELVLEARIEGDELVMLVCDDGPGIPKDQATTDPRQKRGVGLRNTRERLEQLYGRRHSIELRDARPHGLCIEIHLPYETGSTG